MTASLERQALIWMAERAPNWVTPDGLTLLGLLAQAMAGVCYAWARLERRALWLVCLCLVLNWLGDSLDGTVARVRGQQRPRYGFYVDHVVDVLGSTALLVGMGCSGMVHWQVALGMLVAFLLLASESFLATYTLGSFELSQGWFGPTELRLLLVGANLALLHSASVTVLGHRMFLLDAGGCLGIAGMGVVLLVTAARHTRQLYREEPLGRSQEAPAKADCRGESTSIWCTPRQRVAWGGCSEGWMERGVKDLLTIEAVAAKLALPEEMLEKRSKVSAKLSLALLRTGARRGKMILVTATTPTASGEGKTVTSIGLAQGLAAIGKRAIITSREPSLGPVFGMKGGAAGGGLSQIEPAAKINLHFHGDFHAITSAHNLLSALIDSHLFHGNELGLDAAGLTWPRALDMNDRALRRVTVSVTAMDKKQREGSNRDTGFVITAASEIMAILALAKDRQDLRVRLARIIVGADKAGRPVTAEQLGAVGPMMALLSEALLPNLVQTTEGTPATVHCGPFANIAHGTSSVVSQEMGLRLADYVVNETGFASDLGFEKYMDLVMPAAGITPALAVLVTTVQSVRLQGEGDLERGLANLKKHIGIIRGFKLPVIVAINRFPNDTEAELARLEAFCLAEGAEFALSEAFAKGGEGAAALARKVVAVIEANPETAPVMTYAESDSAVEKITKVAQKIYGADGVVLSERAQASLTRIEGWGFGHLPICIAKTQYSLSDDPKRMGAPTGWTLQVSDVSLSAGAGFLVVTAGAILLMPGLPKVSRAMAIDVDAEGEIIGMG